MTPNLFRMVLGEAYDRLPAPIQAIHTGAPRLVARGQCAVERGSHPLGRLCAWVAMLPPAVPDLPVTITITAENGIETWDRRFGTHRMRSRLSARDGMLHETLGPVSFRFRLLASPDGIAWQTMRIRALGIPLPLSWFRFKVGERVEHGRYVFDVRAELLFIGLLVHYRGWLEAEERDG